MQRKTHRFMALGLGAMLACSLTAGAAQLPETEAAQMELMGTEAEEAVLSETDVTEVDLIEAGRSEEETADTMLSEIELIETEAEQTQDAQTEVTVSYSVCLPEGYEEGGRNYPCVYLMPSNGHTTDLYDAEDIQKSLGDLPLVVVSAEFAEGADYRTALNALVADVESRYAVIPEASYRAILGADVGGYMALETMLISESDLFYGAGSVMGTFTGEANPYAENGSLLEAANQLERAADKGYEFLGNHYFYIEGPNQAAETTVEGGTTDVGASLEKKSNPYYQYGQMYYLYATPDTGMVNYSVLEGKQDSAYALSGIGRALESFNERFTAQLLEGTGMPDPQVVTVDDQTSVFSGSVTLAEEASKFTGTETDITLTVSMLDPANGEVLAQQTVEGEKLSAGGALDYSVELPLEKKAAGSSTLFRLSANVLGVEKVLDEKKLVLIQPDGDTEDSRQIDLMGSWYFKAYKEYRAGDREIADLDQIANIVPGEYESWGQVQPCLGWWTADFDDSLNGQENFGGYAWYVRTFDVPEDFPQQQLLLSAGFFDEANEVYINGALVGSTGMDYTQVEGIGVYDESNPWDTECVYTVDPAVLQYGTKNTIAIRMCNSSGGGGWYAGPVGLYTQASYDRMKGKDAGSAERFFEASYTSQALGGETETYRIYLPEEYAQEGNEKTYPVLYLLHGINSQSKTFEIDHVDQYFDQAIAEGRMEPMIVVMPDDPTKTSFWQGEYADMVTDDLIAEVDSTYRTITDRSGRYIGGCSMGGGGAMSIGLHHPELFSGIISFYGALEYVDALQTAETMDASVLGEYHIYMTCGNEDLYNFYESQEQMSRLLTEKGVEHHHEVNRGRHASDYYLPRLIDAVQYVSSR